MPTLSIVMNTYNRVELLKRCIESVISQSFQDWEMVIVDDHSQDSTPQFLKELTQRDARIRYFRNEKNEGADRKKAYSLISYESEYVIFLDDDDYYVDNTFFARGLEIFDCEQGLAFVCGHADYGELDPSTNEIQRYSVKRTLEGRYSRQVYLEQWDENGHYKPLSTFPSIFSRKALDRADLSKMMRIDDTAIYLRALLAGDLYWLPKPVVGVYYHHLANLSRCLSANFILDNLKDAFIVFDTAHQEFPSLDFTPAKCRLTTSCINYFVANSHPSNRAFLQILCFLFRTSPKLYSLKQLSAWSYKVLRWNAGALYGSLVNRFKKKTTE